MEENKKSPRNPHELHRQRMKSRFLKNGIDSFSPHEILELLLYNSIRRKNTNEEAHRLLKAFGSLSGVLDASYEDLVKIEGIGSVSAYLLTLIPEICRAYMVDKNSEGQTLKTPQQLGDYFKYRFVGQDIEQAILLCMDNQCKVLYEAVIDEGTVDFTKIPLRKVLDPIVRFSATAIVLAHNHPRGMPLPSAVDISGTKEIQRALQPFGIQLLDHIIVASDTYISLTQAGFLLNAECL